MMLEWVLSSCALILIVLALRSALGGKISARLRYALWVAVLVRLLIPVQLFPSPVAGLAVDLPQMDGLEDRSVYVLPVQRAPVDSADVTVQDGVITSDASSFGYARLEEDGETVVRYADKIIPLELVKWLWGIGTVVMALILLAANLRFGVRLRRKRKPLEGTVSRLPVYVSDGLPSPCLFGLPFPSIYVTPEAAADEASLRHVLAHEETHYRHGDHIWSFLRCGALAVHWWNPLVWLAVVLSRRDGELACDEGALKRLGDAERAAYGETLLSLVTARPGPGDILTCATTMTGDKKSLKERVSRIACQPKSLVSAVVAVVLVTVLAVACAFGRGEEPAEEKGEVPGWEGYLLQEELPYKPDLNRDGEPEDLLLMATEDQMEYGLGVFQGEDPLWKGYAATAHVGWNAYFLTVLDGEDYLLWYQPYMGQGVYGYQYRLFYLENGEEVIAQEGAVSFDINFGSSTHSEFDPQAIAVFMDEVNALLKNSVQLLNTDEDLLATFEEEGALLDTLWWLEGRWDGRGSAQEALEDFAASAASYHEDASAAADGVPAVDEIFSSIQMENIAHIDDSQTVTAAALAAALNGAVGKWRVCDGDTVEGFLEGVYPYWAVYAEYSVPAWSAQEQTVSLEAGLTENLVRVTCSGYYAGILSNTANPSAGGAYLRDNEYSHTVLVEDENLYWLVRRAFDYPEQIERGLVSPLYEAVTAKMERTLQVAQNGNPEAGYTGYELTEFYTLAAFDDIVPGAEVKLYQNRFALTLEHPEKMVWAGGVYLDSQLREEGFYLEDGGLLAVVWRDGTAEQLRFLASDFYPALDDPEWMEAHGKPYIANALADPDFW